MFAPKVSHQCLIKILVEFQKNSAVSCSCISNQNSDRNSWRIVIWICELFYWNLSTFPIGKNFVLGLEFGSKLLKTSIRINLNPIKSPSWTCFFPYCPELPISMKIENPYRKLCCYFVHIILFVTSNHQSCFPQFFPRLSQFFSWKWYFVTIIVLTYCEKKLF